MLTEGLPACAVQTAILNPGVQGRSRFSRFGYMGKATRTPAMKTVTCAYAYRFKEYATFANAAGRLMDHSGRAVTSDQNRLSCWAMA
jgi:hypothetical protein